MAEFSYNNTMHSTMQQTPIFVNHGLYPKFDIQGANNDVNPTVLDQDVWLEDI